MEEDLMGNAVRRDLTEEDDLEQQLDHDYVRQDRELKNKILFSIQGLGGIRTIQRQGKTFEAYIKGNHCQESVKDLVKFIRMDSPVSPKSRLMLAEYNIVDSDLLKLLPLQVDDKKLSFWIIALLALLTARPSEQLIGQQLVVLNRSLRAYKQSFIDRECFQILIVHMADFYKLQLQARTQAHHQMQQFTILLLRNLSQIPNDETTPNLHNHFLAALIKQEIMHPILYILQNDFSPFRQKIDIPLLEILYHFFTCFDPTTIYPISDAKNSIFARALASKRSSINEMPTRHSRFLPHFMTSSARGIKKLSYKIQTVEKEEAPLKGQRKAPVRLAEFKKVIPLELDRFGSDFMTINFESDGAIKTLGQIATLQIEQFLEVEFELLVKLVFNEIFRQTPKVTDQNVMQYLLLSSWALQMVRARYHHFRACTSSEQQKSQIKFQLSWIVQVLQNAHFQLIYKILYQEATREKRKQFKINMFNAAIKLFSSYLDVVDDLSQSMNTSDRNNANVLLANVFRHEVAKIIRLGFTLVSHEGIISHLIRLTHKFFKLLSIYSDGKVLTMTTNRLLKKKKRHYSDDEGDEIQNYRQHEEHAENQKVAMREMREQEGRFQERKYNEKSQFAVLAEYDIISKYIAFLKGQRFLQNSAQFNDAIFFYLVQIKKLLGGEWLYYQAQTLSCFQLILANHEWVRKNKPKGQFIQAICLSFIQLLKKNPLALVQSLFKYHSLTLKSQILQNYTQEYDYAQQQQENMFTDE